MTKYNYPQSILILLLVPIIFFLQNNYSRFSISFFMLTWFFLPKLYCRTNIKTYHVLEILITDATCVTSPLHCWFFPLLFSSFLPPFWTFSLPTRFTGDCITRLNPNSASVLQHRKATYHQFSIITSGTGLTITILNQYRFIHISWHLYLSTYWKISLFFFSKWSNFFAIIFISHRKMPYISEK